MVEELSPSQVARRLGTSTRTVQRWIEAGTLPARRVGGRWRVASDAFGAFESATTSQIRPIRRLFIANRGEIARRITRTGDRLGIGAIVPPTDGDGALDLLDAGAVVAAALAAGTDAVHPGFGFLAESPDFAERVEAAGLTWVGPPPGAIRTMGDKAAARRLAGSIGVPVLAGYDDADQSDDGLQAAAERIGYPVLVKPAAGGGGKGIRVVRDPATLGDSIAGARREARATFGDDRLILERYVERGRHIEIQVLFDAAGNGVHLGERDCSIQRRHQKILEETPSPGVEPALRERLGDAALALARAVGYVNAGTCEFLVDDRGEPAFLEMNTRLQVEHPVTELVTGRDLVADQLRIAAGEPLGFGQADVVATGHAVEVRLYAEDAETDFLPQTGRIEALRWPTGDGIRVDAGIEVGSVIGGRFDPMLAKIVAWGQTREVALDRLAAALDETLVLGLVTNLRFLRWLVSQPIVRDGAARTDTLDRIWPPDDWASRAAIPTEAWSAAAAALTAAPDPRNTWAGAWRLNGTARVRLRADDGQHTATAEPSTDDAPKVVRVGDVVHVDVAGRSVAIGLAPPPDADRAAHGSGTVSGAAARIRAPMPGQVLTVHVRAGDPVTVGDPIVTLEAMKMEHVVAAPMDGVVGVLAVAAGDQVARGQDLATIEPPP